MPVGSDYWNDGICIYDLDLKLTWLYEGRGASTLIPFPSLRGNNVSDREGCMDVSVLWPACTSDK